MGEKHGFCPANDVRPWPALDAGTPAVVSVKRLRGTQLKGYIRITLLWVQGTPVWLKRNGFDASLYHAVAEVMQTREGVADGPVGTLDGAGPKHFG
jgi:hypothetical protein